MRCAYRASCCLSPRSCHAVWAGEAKHLLSWDWPVHFQMTSRPHHALSVRFCTGFGIPSCLSRLTWLPPAAGGIGAARNLAALRALAITHVVNASPIVPCFHAACLRYRTVAVFDDCGEDISQFFEATNRWINKVQSRRAAHN